MPLSQGRSDLERGATTEACTNQTLEHSRRRYQCQVRATSSYRLV